MKKSEDFYNKIAFLWPYFFQAFTCRRMLNELNQSIIEGSSNGGEYKLYSMYTNLWYSCLYTVVEGWRDQQLSNKTIDELILSSNTDLLRKYRNAIFHFQTSDNFWKKTNPFIESTENPINWANQLTEALKYYFDQAHSQYLIDHPDQGFC